MDPPRYGGAVETDDPAAHAALDRVAALLARSRHLQLQVVMVAPPDRVRLEARERARSAAVAAGRGRLLDAAVIAARDEVMHAFARSGFSGTWALTDMAMSVARPEDRVAAASALEEAAIAEVVEDLVDDDTLEVLRSTAAELGELTNLPAPGSIAGFGAPATWLRGPVRVALFIALAIGLALVGLVGSSLVMVALGIAIAIGIARRRDQTS